ncbi:DUF6538 domain-containing protein [Paracoccus fontiphilus]|uniref:DUF6538 domain-containing protein n=1 Tax=Paracoccus fontiphilus TaxID=1815556 RepID=A0ABV7ILW0_9RHOB|nr:DUF6538 domain-containing protein [Paracoccus fontiphilus]
MPRPTQRKPGSPFYFRARVPADLVQRLGKREVSYSLQTSDETEAKRRFAAELAKHQAHWEAIRKGPQPIPLKTIMALGGEFYRKWLTSLSEEPGEPTMWTQVAENKEAISTKQGNERQEALAQWYGPVADELLLRHGLLADEASRERLLDRLHDTAVRATETLSRQAQGDYGADPHEDRFPAPLWPVASPVKVSDDAPGETLTGLFETWEKQAKADGKPAATIRDFRQKVNDLIAFLGHDIIRDIKPVDIVRWTDHLRDERKLSGKTIGQKYLAALRLMFSFAKSRAMGLGDPTDGIRVKAPKRETTRDRGFTDDEAKRILAAARASVGVSDRMSVHLRRAIRWVPWVCAHTGARVTEITQLRRSDLITVDGIPCIRITPEAGSVKTGNHRIVPLHPQLVREGFVTMVEAMPNGPLFHAKGASAKVIGARVGEWVRDHAKVKDPAVQPNHAWRHRLKTLRRDHALDAGLVDHMQGHSNPSAAEGYGDKTVKAMYREICKLPDYLV